VTDVLEQIERFRQLGVGTAAMATLVSAKGSTPRTAGARMWVGDGGRILGSVTIGGCVDARVIAESERALREGGARLLTFSLGDEEAWEIGLTCGGEIEVLIERVDASDESDAVVAAYRDARRIVAANGEATVVTRLDGPRSRLVATDDELLGTLGDRDMDAAAASIAHQRRGVAWIDTVTTVGGSFRLYFEHCAAADTVVIYGAGEIARSLVPIVRELGMHTVLVDGRERFATRERFPDADEIRVGMPSEIAEQLPVTSRTHVVLVAHDYKYELPVLRLLLPSNAGYVGMLGSRRRGETIKRMLREDGVPDEAIARLHTPIGIDIGARSTAEIALAIAAEIIAVREGKHRRAQAAPRAAMAAQESA
jgi:xanthine dehydrogenase accessory factor